MRAQMPVLVEGRSGSGKSYGLKGFKKDEIGVIAVEKSRLPFRNDLNIATVPDKFGEEIGSMAQLNAARYSWVEMLIKKSKAKSIAIDDSQYLLAIGLTRTRAKDSTAAISSYPRRRGIRRLLFPA